MQKIRAELISTNISLVLSETSEGLVLSVNDRPSITLEGDWQQLVNVLNLADGTCDDVELVDRARGLGLLRSEAEEIIEFCLEEGFLTHGSATQKVVASDIFLGKFDRQIKNFSTLQGQNIDSAQLLNEKLASSHVAILGVGGVGSYLALSAAMLGVGRISLIDFDDVETSNVPRQVLYRDSDVGQPKVIAAKKYLVDRNPDLLCDTYSVEVTGQEDLIKVVQEAESKRGNVDLLLMAADTPRGAIQQMVDDACHVTQTPWMEMGPSGFSRIQLGPLIIPGTTRSYSDFFPPHMYLPDSPSVAKINGRFVATTMDPYNSLAAKMGMIEAVKFLTGYTRPKIIDSVVVLDTGEWSIEHHDL